MQETNLNKIEKLILELAEKSDGNILLIGETGTGKERAAKQIHNNSIRDQKPFIVLNANTIFSTDKLKKSLFKSRGATLYLDEIGRLDTEIQNDFLEILNDSEISYNIRIISANKHNLLQDVENGLFNKELYLKLAENSLYLPPLRVYGDEIISIAEKLILEYAKTNRKPLKQLTQGAKEVLLKYDFPNNFRELKAIIDLTLMMSEQTLIYPNDIYLRNNIIKQDILLKEKSLERYETEIIEHFLKKYDNRAYFVAKKLGVSKNKIYSTIKKIKENGTLNSDSTIEKLD